MISDPNLKDNPVVYANSALSMITGYNKSDVYGKNCRFLQSDDLKQTAITTFREAIKENCATTVALRNYRKDSTFFWNIVTASPIFDGDGQPKFFLGIQQDVTNRIRVEKENQSLQQRILLAAKFEAGDRRLAYTDQK